MEKENDIVEQLEKFMKVDATRANIQSQNASRLAKPTMPVIKGDTYLTGNDLFKSK